MSQQLINDYTQSVQKAFHLSNNHPVTIKKKYGIVTASFTKGNITIRASYMQGWHVQ